MMAQRIITLRKRSGLTQSQLADQLHISPSALGNYEQGRRVPNMEILIAISEFFGVSLDYLITGKESRDSAAPSEMPHCPCTTCYWASRDPIA